jgi:hypothetical protein
VAYRNWRKKTTVLAMSSLGVAFHPDQLRADRERQEIRAKLH